MCESTDHFSIKGDCGNSGEMMDLQDTLARGCLPARRRAGDCADISSQLKSAMTKMPVSVLQEMLSTLGVLKSAINQAILDTSKSARLNSSSLAMFRNESRLWTSSSVQRNSNKR